MPDPATGLPEIWHGLELPSIQVCEWVQRVADEHFEEDAWDSEAELSTAHYPVCASPGAVRPHIDEFNGAELGKRIYGLVIRSDGHSLMTEAMVAAGLQPIPLQMGDLYGLDPHDRHWTLTDVPDGQLIFVCTFLPVTDPRYGKPNKIAHDLRWETLKANIDAMRAAEQKAAEVKAMYRGIEPVGR